jgi:prepilin-type N-terminal cleavage/methylation domain-containing protein
MRSRLLRGRQEGFTLIELVEAMALLGILTATVAVVLTSLVRQSSDVHEQSVLQTEIRPAVDRLAQDLRQAYGGEGVTPIETIGDTTLTFLSPDRAEPFHVRRVAYRVSGLRLERAVAASTDTDGPPWSIPALGAWEPQSEAPVVNAVVFTYFDSAGATTTVAADVRAVGVRIVTELATTPGRQVAYETSVTVRPSE